MLRGAARQSGFWPLVGRAHNLRAVPPVIIGKNNVSWSRPDSIPQSEMWLAGEPLRLGLTVPTADRNSAYGAECAVALSIRHLLRNNNDPSERPMRTRASTWFFGPILGAVISLAAWEVCGWLLVHLGAR